MSMGGHGQQTHGSTAHQSCHFWRAGRLTRTRPFVPPQSIGAVDSEERPRRQQDDQALERSDFACRALSHSNSCVSFLHGKQAPPVRGMLPFAVAAHSSPRERRHPFGDRAQRRSFPLSPNRVILAGFNDCMSEGGSWVAEEFQNLPGDRQPSWTELYAQYATWFAGRLVRRYGAQEAEDIGQETWLRLARYQRGRDIRHPKALLLRIASNLVSDRRVRQSREHRYSEEALRCERGQGDLPHQTEDVMARQLLASLPEPLRDVFVLSRFAGLTNAQIGERLGISRRTVDWRMTRALAHCAAQLRR